MATEVLNVPEEHLAEVISVIRAGLKSQKDVSEDVRRGLEDWCDGEEKYLEEIANT